MFEYTVHFQKGKRVGARSFRMVHVHAAGVGEAVQFARQEFNEPGYRITRVDHFDENGRIVIDR